MVNIGWMGLSLGAFAPAKANADLELQMTPEGGGRLGNAPGFESGQNQPSLRGLRLDDSKEVRYLH